NKDLHDETERISKESKDVSNESKTVDAVYNAAFEVTQELSKRIVELEKDLSKFKAKNIDFEIVNFDEIETKNIELEHQVTSLIKENEHLKLTYKSLFDSIKKLRVQTKTSNVTQNEAENLKSQLFEFAETKFNNILEKIEFFKKNHFDSFSSSNVNCNISELKKASGEKHNLFENETSVFQIKIEELEKSLAKQTKENSNLLMKIDNLENVFADEEKKATFGKRNAFDKENYDFLSKVIHLEKIIAQKSKDFDDVNLELSNRTAKFEAYFEKLENTKVVLERQLARKVDDSKAEKDQFLKEINHLRTQLENLKGKSDLSKPVTAQSLPENEKDQLLKQIASLESKLASQDIRSCQKEYRELRTSYNALKKDRKFSKNSQKGFKTRASNAKNHFFETSHSHFTPVKQMWRSIKESQTFEVSTSQKRFKTRTLKGKNQVFVTPHSRFTPVKQVWRPKQSHLKTFKYSKSEMLSMQNKNDLALENKNNERSSNASKMNF
nr:hypothetical protein [Tanacetum cinerariifolium]